MSDIAIKFENISKQYRLGTIGTGTLSHDLNRWWAMKPLGTIVRLNVKMIKRYLL